MEWIDHHNPDLVIFNNDGSEKERSKMDHFHIYVQYILSTWQSFLSTPETRENTIGSICRVTITRRLPHSPVFDFLSEDFSHFCSVLRFPPTTRWMPCFSTRGSSTNKSMDILYPQATFQNCKCHASLMNLSPEIADFLQRGISWHMELRWHMFFTWTGLGLIIHN